MRLTENQLQAIKASFSLFFLKTDSLWLFGSRVDPLQKGGDIDLYIETMDPDLQSVMQRKLRFLVDLKRQIGDQKIDVVICCLKHSTTLAIYDEAKQTGIRLV